MLSEPRTIGPIGTATRTVIGGAITVLGITVHGIGWWDLVAALTVLPMLAIGVAALVNTGLKRSAPTALARARSPWSGPQIAASVVVIAAVLAVGTVLTFVSPVNGVALYVFFGLSMLLAALRGYDGCEVLALPNLILRRQDALWCPLYTPIDAAAGRRPEAPPEQ